MWPGSVDEALLTPTPEMLAAGPPVTLDLPTRLGFSVPGTSGGNAIQPVMVHAQIDGQGNATDVELCAASDQGLAQSALELVAKRNFGTSGSQRQVYVEVKFGPTAQ